MSNPKQLDRQIYIFTILLYHTKYGHVECTVLLTNNIWQKNLKRETNITVVYTNITIYCQTHARLFHYDNKMNKEIH